MAKKRRNTKKKHNENQEQGSSDFLADVPETSSEAWDQGDDLNNPQTFQDNNKDQDIPSNSDAVVDPYAEQFEQQAQDSHDQQDSESQANAFENAEASEETIEDISPNEEHVEADTGSSFSLGNFLRDQREQQGISLKNVSQSTKISLTNLEYLEEDDIHSLPDRAYVTGYVKSYAKLLGTDVKFCLDLLEKTYQSRGATPREPEIVIPQAQNSPKISQGFPLTKIAAIAAMIIVIVGIVGFFMTRDTTKDPDVVAQQEELQQEETEEDEKEITPQTLNAETPLQEDLSQQEEEPPVLEDEDTQEIEPVVAKPKETIKEENKVAEVTAEATKEKKDKEEKKTEEGEDTKEKRKFYPLSNELYTVDSSFAQEKIDELLPPQFKVTPVDGIQAVFITAVKGDSWLTYKSDNDPIKKFVLKEGRSLLFRAKEARVFLGNLGAVKIFLNNKPLKITSRTGVKSLVFPQENSSNYVMPLFIYKEDGSVQTSKEWIEENE